MQKRQTALPEVILFELAAYGDQRGFFRELFRVNTYQHAGIKKPFVQYNHSRSSEKVLRGLHYQKEYPQGKLVSVTHGAILDVVIDIRYGSPTFGKWIAEELSDQNHRQLYIPPGYAHAVLTLSERADLLYQCTEYYHPEDEQSIAWNDPTLNIVWPIHDPILSEKDSNAPFLHELPLTGLPKYTEASPTVREAEIL